MGHPWKSVFYYFYRPEAPPLLKGLARSLNQPKKRPARARIGRYLGFIEAQLRSAPVFLMLSARSVGVSVGNSSRCKKFCKDRSTCAKTRGACYRVTCADPWRFLTTPTIELTSNLRMQDHLAHRLAAREHLQGVGGLR